MNKEEFLALVWRFEELLMQLDYLRNQIGNCPDRCERLETDDDEGLCPICCNTYAKILAEEKRLAKDDEFSLIMKKLKRACDEDLSGTYQRILDQVRQGKVVH